ARADAVEPVLRLLLGLPTAPHDGTTTGDAGTAEHTGNGRNTEYTGNARSTESTGSTGSTGSAGNVEEPLGATG
ncbi:hypothetical protein ACFV1C_37325, partial [Streptomyces sp. NPDC059605]